MGISELLEKFDKFLDRWPGKERFGPYRFLPVFFVSGALVEYLMIHWRPYGINFYDTYTAKKSQEEALKRWNTWKAIESEFKK